MSVLEKAAGTVCRRKSACVSRSGILQAPLRRETGPISSDGKAVSREEMEALHQRTSAFLAPL